MTTIADATDNATVEQLTQAVAGLQETVENLQNTAEQQAKTIDHQDKRIDDLEAELKDELKSELRAELKDEVMAEVEALRDRVDMQSDLIHDLKAELDNQSNNVSGAFAKLSAIDDRLEALEEGEAQVSQGDPSDPDQSHETPLEQVCSLPENVAQSELTANQERARFRQRT